MRSPEEIAHAIVAQGWAAPAPKMEPAIAQAIRDERDRCARVALDAAEGSPGCGCPKAISDAILAAPAPTRR